MAAVTALIATLPIATRAWCLRDPVEPRGSEKSSKTAVKGPVARRPERFIAIDTECLTSAGAELPGFDGERWAPEDQPLLFGSAVVGRTSDLRIKREIIFYPDDLPESAVAALTVYFENQTFRHGARPRKDDDPQPYFTWRDERRVVVQLLPLSEFLNLFFRIACEDRALVLGDRLAFQLTRFASRWHVIKKGDSLGAWRLTLWPRSAGYRPFIDLKHPAPDVNFIGFSSRRVDERGSRYPGEFLDVSDFAHALTGRHWTLADACATFTAEELDNHVEPGRIAPECIDRRRHHLRAVVSLARRLLELFDRLHPVSRGAGGRLSETRLYSPGGIARAYLRAAGFSPPAVPEDRLGACVAAFHGGWAEVGLRGRAPTVHVDFRRQYQTVFLLQRLQDLLAAERLAFTDDTEAIREFVASLTLDDLLRPDTWPRLNAICWVKPAGEAMLGRWAFNEKKGSSNPERFSLAMAERHSDNLVPMYLASVIAAKLLSGRVPAIVRAERIVPEGRQRLRKTGLFGDARFDPANDQLFKIFVEEGERFNRGEKRYSEIPIAVRAAILPGIKAVGNIGCFGALMETRQVDLLPGRREEATLLAEGEPFRAALAHPEDSGPFACPPIAGLVSAGGQLLLAMVHRLVADRGGVVAACDTDGAHIVGTEAGGTVAVETRGADYHECGPAQPVRALSLAEVQEIAALFEPLNPFDRKLLPGSPLQMKGASNGLFISAKRYALSGPDGRFIDCKESILGMLQPPSENWIEDAWRVLDELWDGRPLTRRWWLGLPAVRALAATSPAQVRGLDGLSHLRPWTRFLVAHAIGRKTSDPKLGRQEPLIAIVVAPFDPEPENWPFLPWRFADTGNAVPLDRPDANGIAWRLRTIGEFLTSYARHPIAEMLAPDGSPCGAFTRGVLRRRAIRDGERWLVLKEAAVYGDDPRNAFSMPTPETVRQSKKGDRQRGDSAAWERMIRPALPIIGPPTIALSMGLAARSVRAWAAGERRPEKPDKIAKAIVAVAREAGLGMPGDEHLRAEQICAELPARVRELQCFISFATAMLADRLGGIRALARAMAKQGNADNEPALRRWLALATGELRSVRALKGIIRRLARFSRAQIRNSHRRIRTEPGPAGERQAILAYISLLYGANSRPPCRPVESLFAPLIIIVAIVIAFLIDIAPGFARPMRLIPPSAPIGGECG